MLKPIHRVPCWPALAACQRLMQALAGWLCDPDCAAANVTEQHCRERMPTLIESDWLWGMLQLNDGKRPLLNRAQTIATISVANKQALAAWVQAVSNVASHFVAPVPTTLPTAPPFGGEAWAAFKTLMSAFYEKGLCQLGLPYLLDGTPTNDRDQWLSYAQYRETFRQRHRQSNHPDARDLCVLCGGTLTQPAVDHWIRKAAFPLLAVCADNLLPICGTCNQAPNKGSKDVHAAGSFADWFHPHFRPGSGSLMPGYSRQTLSVSCLSVGPEDVARVANLDRLLNLSTRWTIILKAEHADLRDELRRRYESKDYVVAGEFTEADVRKVLNRRYCQLPPATAFREVLELLFQEAITPEALAALHTETLLNSTVVPAK